MIGIDLRNVTESSDFNLLPPGGYICKIVNVTDVASKKYLAIEYDIADGEYKGYFQKKNRETGKWTGCFNRSYKSEATLPFFKSFITAVQESNRNFRYDDTASYFDETELIDKYIGLVIGEEEFKGKDGKIKKGLQVRETRSVDKIRMGDFKMPKLKKLEGAEAENIPEPEFYTSVDDTDLPF